MRIIPGLFSPLASTVWNAVYWEYTQVDCSCLGTSFAIPSINELSKYLLVTVLREVHWEWPSKFFTFGVLLIKSYYSKCYLRTSSKHHINLENIWSLSLTLDLLLYNLHFSKILQVIHMYIKFFAHAWGLIIRGKLACCQAGTRKLPLG